MAKNFDLDEYRKQKYGTSSVATSRTYTTASSGKKKGNNSAGNVGTGVNNGGFDLDEYRREKYGTSSVSTSRKYTTRSSNSGKVLSTTKPISKYDGDITPYWEKIMNGGRAAESYLNWITGNGDEEKSAEKTFTVPEDENAWRMNHAAISDKSDGSRSSESDLREIPETAEDNIERVLTLPGAEQNWRKGTHGAIGESLSTRPKWTNNYKWVDSYKAVTEGKQELEEMLDFYQTHKNDYAAEKIEPVIQELEDMSAIYEKYIEAYSPFLTNYEMENGVYLSKADEANISDADKEKLWERTNYLKYSDMMKNEDFVELSAPMDNRAPEVAVGNTDLNNYVGVQNSPYMTDDEKAVYYYLMNTRGETAADKYLYDIDRYINERKAQEYVSGEVNFMDWVKSNLPEMINQPIFSWISQKINNPDAPIDENAGFQTLLTNSLARQKITNNIDSSVGKFMYGLDRSMLDSIGGQVLSYFFGKGVGGTALGLGAGANEFYASKSAGKSDAEAFESAGVSAASEALFEELSIGKLLKDAPNVKSWKSFLSNVFTQAGVNASEEVITEMATNAHDYFRKFDNSNYNIAVRNYKRQGYTQEEAEKKAINDYWTQTLEAGLAGAISGGAMTAGKGAVTLSVNNSSFNDVYDYAYSTNNPELSDIWEKSPDSLSASEKEAVYKVASEDVQQKLGQATSQEELDQLRDDALLSVGSNPYLNSIINEMYDGRSKILAKTSNNDNSDIYLFDYEKENPSGSTTAKPTNASGSIQNSAAQSIASKILNTGSASNREIRTLLSDASAKAEFEQATGIELNGTVAENRKAVKTALSSLPAVQSEIEESQPIQIPTSTQTQNTDRRTIAGANIPVVSAKLAQTGIEVEIVGFDTVDKGHVTVKLSDGVAVPFSSLSLPENGAAAILYNYAAKTMPDAKTANNLIGLYKGGNVNTYIRGWNNYYSAGVFASEGQSFSDAKKHYGAYYGLIGEDAARAAYEAGRADVEGQGEMSLAADVKRTEGTYTDKSGHADDEMQDIDRAIAKKIGLDVETVDTLDNANAQFNVELAKLVFANDADNPYAARMHELAEVAYARNNGEMLKVRDAIIDWFCKNQGYNSTRELIEATQTRYKCSFQNAKNEVVNDAISGLFSTEEGVNNFLSWLSEDSGMTQTEQKTIIQKLADLFKGFVEYLKNVISSGHLNKAAQTAMQMQADEAARIRKMFLEVLEGSSEHTETSTSAIRNSLKGDSIDRYTQREYNNYGWVAVNNVLTGKELRKLYSQFSDAVKNKYKYPISVDGDFIIAVGDKYDTDDKLVYISGTISNPQIEKVIEIIGLEGSYISDIIQGVIDYEQIGNRNSYEIIEAYSRQKIFSVHMLRDYQSYREYRQSQLQRGISTENYQDNREKQIAEGRNSENKDNYGAGLDKSAFSFDENKRFSLKDTESIDNQRSLGYDLYGMEGDKLGRKQQQKRRETTAEFIRRAEKDSLRIVKSPSGLLTAAFRNPRRLHQRVESETKQELTRLGINGFIYDGNSPLLIHKGNQTMSCVGSSVAIDNEMVAIGIADDANTREYIGHEALHYWSKFDDVIAYINYIKENLILDKDFSKLYEHINNHYFNGDFDMSNIKEKSLFFEEVAAYISGDIHANKDITGLFNNPDEVIEMWDKIVSARSTDGKGIPNSIRHSLKDTDIDPAEYKSVLKQNEHYREVIENLRSQFRTTKGVKFNPKSLGKVVNKVLRDYNSSYDSAKLTEELHTAYKYIADGGDVFFEDFMDMLRDIAANVVDNPKQAKAERSEYSKAVLSYVRGMKLSLTSTQRQWVEQQYDGYNSYRRQNFGSINLTKDGVPLDAAWISLSEEFPGLFPADTAEADMPFVLADTLQMMKEDYVVDGREELSRYDTIEMLAAELYESYYDVSQVHTLADKHQREITLLRSKHHEKMQKLKTDLREKYENELKELKAANAQRVKDTREKANERTERLIAQVKANQRESVAKQKERQSNIQHRRNIKRNAAMLMDWLNKPNRKKGYIPDALSRPLAQFLAKINSDSTLTTKEARRWQESMKDTVKTLRRLQQSNYDESMVADVYINIPQGLLDRMEDFADSADNRPNIEQMNGTELAELDSLLKLLRGTISNINRMHIEGKTVERSEFCDEGIADLKKRKVKKTASNKVLRAVQNTAVWDFSNAITFSDRLGKTGKIINDALDGYGRVGYKIREAQEALKNALGNIKINDLTGSKAKTHMFTTEEGSSIALTTGQIMDLYLLSKREQAVSHIFGAGIIADTQALEKAKNKLRKKDGSIPRKQLEELLRKHSPTRITPTDLANIINVLTDEQRAVADKLQQYVAKDVAAWGNETSRQMYTVSLFTEPNYWTIQSSNDFLRTNDSNTIGSLYRIQNMGFTKPTVKYANNAIIVGDVFDVFSQHVGDMALYSELAIPLSNMMSVFNYKQSPDVSMKSVMGEVLGNQSRKYFTNLVESIQGLSPEGYGTGWMNTLIRNSKTAKVGFSLRTAMLQFTAYPRAMMVIDPKYLIHAPKTHGIEKARRYSAMANWKSLGFFTTDVAPSIKEVILNDKSIGDRVKEWSMKLAEKGDELTWGALWNACEAEARDHIKKGKLNYELDSEEFYRHVGKRMDEVINRTQVIDTVFHRAESLRSKDLLVKTATSFKSEDLMTYNMFVQALESGDKGKMFRALGAFALTKGAAIVIGALASALRDDDDDESAMEKYLQALQKEVWSENKNGALGVIGNILNLTPIGGLPYISDIAEICAGYDIERMDTEAVSDIATGIETLIKRFNGSLSSTKTGYGEIQDYAAAASTVSGIPIGNIIREGVTFWNAVADDNVKKKLSNSERYSRMVNAMVKSNMNEYNRHYDVLRTRLTSTDPEAAISSGLSKEIINRYESGAFTEQQTVNYLTKYAGLSDTKANEKVLHSMTGGSDYGLLDAAVATGNSSKIQAEINRVVKAGIEEDAARNRVKSKIKESYLSNSGISDANIANLLTKYGGCENSETSYAQMIRWKYSSSSDYAGLNSAMDGSSTRTMHTAIAELKRAGYSEERIFTYFRNEYKKEYKNASAAERQRMRALFEASGVFWNLDSELSKWARS